MTRHVPSRVLDIVGLTDEETDPTTAIQYAVRTPDGRQHLYGDQSWVAFGRAISDGSHPGGVVVQRTITITYGEWQDPAAELLARARTYLQLCGSCDAGLPTGCTCPRGDARTMIAALVDEVEHLSGGAS